VSTKSTEPETAHARAADAGDRGRDLEEGRKHYGARAWAKAYHALDRADRAAPLEREDLERLAWSAGLSGREGEHRKCLDRFYQASVEAGDCAQAARAAFWLGFRLAMVGEMASAGGWLSRAQRLVESAGADCAVAGYLLLPEIRQRFKAGDYDSAYDAATRAAEIGERCRDTDLLVFARNLQGRIRVRQGQVGAGLPLLDEAMLSVTQGETSPAVTGLIYCTAIATCNSIYAIDRSREWTSALSQWVESQPELVPFTSACLASRAEVLRLGGDWPEAFDQARKAHQQRAADSDIGAAGQALYQEGEIHRLRGALVQAESAYHQASQNGFDPQPGLALLRLAQGKRDDAAGAIRRALAALPEPLARARCLPAMVDIAIAGGDVGTAREACAELEATAARFGTDVLGAIAARARGDVELASGNAEAALAPLRRAFQVWRQVGAPYEAARARVALGRACVALGDREGAALELAAAREVFERLGAAPSVAAIDAPTVPAREIPKDHPLTARELEVLRLVAAGKTNKAIGKELFVSEKTVDRHVSNIFAKLDVSSRAAATAYAYEHGLV